MKRNIMTKKELLFLLLAITVIASVITVIFVFLPSSNYPPEPTVVFSTGTLQSVEGDLLDLPVNITCLNASITLISVSSNACIGLGVVNNNSENVIPLYIQVNDTSTVYLRCSFQENIIYLIEFYFQLDGFEFTKILKFER